MINHVQFPALGINLTVNRVAFTLFGLDIYWYGVIITTGIVLSAAIGLKFGEKYFNINQDNFIDVILVTAFFGIASARAYYVAFAPFKYNSLWDMINLRDGGLAIYGGVIGSFLFGYFACKWKKIDYLDAFDVASFCFPLGQAIGRWGNFVNQEAFGTNTTSVFGMFSESTYEYLTRVQSTLAQQGITVNPELPVHPTFLYESIWCFIGFLILVNYVKHRKFKGEIMAMYLWWYGLGRFFIEGLRTDSLEIMAGLRASQLVAIVCVAGATAVLIYNYSKLRKEPVNDRKVNKRKRTGSNRKGKN